MRDQKQSTQLDGTGAQQAQTSIPATKVEPDTAELPVEELEERIAPRAKVFRP